MNQRLQRIGSLPRDATGTLALVERVDDSSFRSIQQNPTDVLRHLLPQQTNTAIIIMIFVPSLKICTPRRTTKAKYSATCLSLYLFSNKRRKLLTSDDPLLGKLKHPDVSLFN